MKEWKETDFKSLQSYVKAIISELEKLWAIREKEMEEEKRREKIRKRKIKNFTAAFVSAIILFIICIEIFGLTSNYLLNKFIPLNDDKTVSAAKEDKSNTSDMLTKTWSAINDYKIKNKKFPLKLEDLKNRYGFDDVSVMSYELTESGYILQMKEWRPGAPVFNENGIDLSHLRMEVKK